MIANNFNIIDRMIFSIEAAVSQIQLSIREEKDPDPEEMIITVTQHLQEENEKLKDFRIPEQLAFDKEKAVYSCPKCKAALNPELIERYRIKFCCECGKRLFRVNNPAY